MKINNDASTVRKSIAGARLYSLYYKPRAKIIRLRRLGFRDSLFSYIGQKQMEEAAYRLRPLTINSPGARYTVSLVSGSAFWYQTCFCLYSLINNSSINIMPVIYDDGTLHVKHVNLFKKIFPGLTFFSREEIEERLDRYLPFSKFPFLRERRITYRNLRKLVDTRAGNSGWQLVVDSDMLFFREPTMLVEWLKSPLKPCHLVDLSSFYLYSIPLMESLINFNIPPRVNVGIIGLNNGGIDWDKVEYWCRVLIEKEGKRYSLEQSLSAMLIAGKEVLALSPKEYILCPGKEECRSPKGIMHHYVADSKVGYFCYGWRHVIKCME